MFKAVSRKTEKVLQDNHPLKRVMIVDQSIATVSLLQTYESTKS